MNSHYSSLKRGKEETNKKLNFVTSIPLRVMMSVGENLEVKKSNDAKNVRKERRNIFGGSCCGND